MIVNGSAARKELSVILWLALLIFGGGTALSQGTRYQVGQVVTNFVLYARPSWTNSAGFQEGERMRLRDFSGKIIFVEFFDPT